MTVLKALVLAIAAGLMLGASGAGGPAAALTAPSGIDARIRLDWEAGVTRRGKPVVRGYVINDHGRPAADVRLLVESLDGAGAVVGRAIGFVPGVVQFNDRAYFEVPIRTPGASYRVTVTSLDWRAGGGAM